MKLTAKRYTYQLVDKSLGEVVFVILGEQTSNQLRTNLAWREELHKTLLSHEVGETDSETVNMNYIAKTLSQDWGFYYTVRI